ncbi:sulfur carrier protein ThiS [Corynebacterium sanguinis]|uniref:sulfur carrier protein ThiS n=1 Tax=Corynebacterium sanguinis TaxID=2594913 RepID=UPI0021AFC1A3|nr:sulfur carrier protein ThiS [Corynebacterium sanguinis]MCT2154781.1 sulfur carrier protein ThiS [Corynebacterium sanguinis]
MSTHILVNETARDTHAATVSELVHEVLGHVPDAGTAVAIDSAVVPRSKWESTQLADGARVDILTAVQGG